MLHVCMCYTRASNSIVQHRSPGKNPFPYDRKPESRLSSSLVQVWRSGRGHGGSLLGMFTLLLFLTRYVAISSHSVKRHALYRPMITKLIIMVIDGLRWDFVAGPMGQAAMPLTSNLLVNSTGCLLRAKLQSPTVTMPRIKAMMTGTVPNFIDIVLNLRSKPLHSDSLLLQANEHGHRLVFYGDDTWLSLFPRIFDRHDGTSSFFVTDFTEVDNNVTRHIRDELNYNDWTVMILHYLGLDHIGHVEGPFGASIKSKLQEMDEIVAQIAQRVQDWNNDRVPTLFIVCGDHGMKDSGGHGGSTPQETTVPFITIGGTRCLRQEDGESIEIEQLDIAATLSTALGLPIPSTNLGSVFLDSIYDLDNAKRLFLLYYNSRQVFNRFRKLAHRESQIEHVYRKYLDAVNLHAAWLNASETQRGMVEMIVLSYNAILKEMKDALISSIIKYDFRSMVVAVFFLCQILFILFFVQTAVWTTYKKTASFFLVRFSLCLGMYYFYNSEDTTSFYPTSIFNALLFFVVIGILYINCDLCINSDFTLTEFTKGPKIRRVFQVGALLHMASLVGSSFIEEEHQTWYFFWTSTIAYFLYRYFTRLLAYHRYDLTSVKVRTEVVGPVGPTCDDTRRHIELCAKLLLLLIGHRVLRKLNSTGDKWAHLPDIARWLKEDDNKVGTTFLLLAALCLLIWIAYECEDKEYKRQSLILNMVIAACIYFRHMSNGAVVTIPLYPSSSDGIHEVRMFWGIITLSLLSYGYRATLIIKRDKRRFASMMLFFIVTTWVAISAMLHQPYNVILLPMQIITSSTLDFALREDNLLDLGILVHYWLGNVFYFYQGNSNSLASIDVAAGYVGLRSYMPLVTGVYLIVNTWSAPVLAYFLLIYHRQLYPTNRTDVVARTSRSFIAWRLLTSTIYMIVVINQRYHLFVWSVFSPKLLYEATYSATMCSSVLVALIVFVVQSAAISNYANRARIKDHATPQEPVQETDTCIY
ncbi:GPI ethanolamine phosphate transferase 2 isoform X2 [Temnothorax longispinosus]|uniref:GPI ethanolamine phosphate transferase 2 isoform X2 n=1 Tax=Temnothorax longispinosus TaxID=300112 RepID=UPI003A9A5A7B